MLCEIVFQILFAMDESVMLFLEKACMCETAFTLKQTYNMQLTFNSSASLCTHRPTRKCIYTFI